MKNSKINNGVSGTNNNKNSEPRSVKPNLVVLSYSNSSDLESALIELNRQNVSVHYIIDEDGNQTQFTNDLTQETFFVVRVNLEIKRH